MKRKKEIAAIRRRAAERLHAVRRKLDVKSLASRRDEAIAELSKLLEAEVSSFEAFHRQQGTVWASDDDKTKALVLWMQRAGMYPPGL